VQLHDRRLNRNAQCGSEPDVNRMPGRRIRRPSEHRDKGDGKEKNKTAHGLPFRTISREVHEIARSKHPLSLASSGIALGLTPVEGKP
jgi:hypothetical protein